MVSIAFTGGGTGGHIYPGLAVASRLKELIPCRIFWIGSDKGKDRAIVERAGLEFFGIPSGKLRRYFSLKNVSDVFRIGAGFFAAWRILKRERPALLFSKGGFVSVPPSAAAKLLKIPVFAHESDYSPGLATRINIRFTEKLFIPYRESARFFPGIAEERIRVSGNPIRAEFAAADPALGRAFLGLNAGERILLVLGGSLGSREINSLVRAALSELTKYYTVVHQTGENDAPGQNAADGPRYPRERYKPYAYFSEEIPHVIAAAELVLCRSGAGTIWECKSLCKPMVLVPFRSGSRGDQVENARLFEEAGAALCFDNAEPGAGPAGDTADASTAPRKLAALISFLAENPEKRKAMGTAKIGESSAAAFIAGEIINALTIRQKPERIEEKK